jgi:hypothetical protein
MFSFFRGDSHPHELVNPANDRGYLRHEISDRVLSHPAMLGLEERILPSYLAKATARHSGVIVELGCYLGGSTVALLDGLSQAGTLRTERGPYVHSYDLFVANEYMLDHTLRSSGVQAGESFEQVYREILGDWAPHVEVHAGDIRKEVWSGDPIKLLYVDILWSWETNQHVFEQFYRAMVPGSWLVHQDFVYSSYPWLPVTMEWLVQKGYFSFRYFAEHSTVAFRCEKPLTDIDEGFDFGKSLGQEAKDELLQNSAKRFRGYPAALLQLSRAVLNIHDGQLAAARTIVGHVKRRYDHPFAKHHVEMVEMHLS